MQGPVRRRRLRSATQGVQTRTGEDLSPRGRDERAGGRARAQKGKCGRRATALACGELTSPGRPAEGRKEASVAPLGVYQTLRKGQPPEQLQRLLSY